MDGKAPQKKDGRSHGRLSVHDKRTFVGFCCEDGITNCCRSPVLAMVSSCSFHPLKCIRVRVFLCRLGEFGLLVSSSLVVWRLHCLYFGLALASYPLCTCPCGDHGGVHCHARGSCHHTTSGSFVSSSPLGRPRVVVGGVQHDACKPWRRTTRVRDGRGNVRKRRSTRHATWWWERDERGSHQPVDVASTWRCTTQNDHVET